MQRFTFRTQFEHVAKHGNAPALRADRRLAIIESLPLDPARRLVLVRLDSTERLLLLGEGRMLAEVPSTTTPDRPA